MIRYKVTNDDDSSIFVGRKDINNTYRLSYKDNEIVEAPKGTLGIMVFDTLENAIVFSNTINRYDLEIKIKKVETLDKEIIPYFISFSFDDYLLHYFYEKIISKVNLIKNLHVDDFIFYGIKEPPKGTICCHKIKVIETVSTGLIGV